MSKKLKIALIVIFIPILYALLTRLFFGADFANIWGIMTMSFLAFLPMGIGVLTTYLSDSEKNKYWSYWIFQPWIPIFGFFLLTLLFALEGWACWLMVLPLFLIAASIGGLIGVWLKNRKDRFNLSLVVLLPFIVSPLEGMMERIPGEYEAITYIDIDAPAEKVWDHVTRVSTISKEDDTGYLTRFLGFPRPIEAELDFEGVGAYRKAIFDKGLVFHETVKEYKDNEKMVFSIKAYPHEIPSTTMDEHVVIGGEFFDVLEGTYEIEKLENGKIRLHLKSSFEMKTTFNFYAGWWGKMIMKDIQNNILKINKKRSESEVI